MGSASVTLLKDALSGIVRAWPLFAATMASPQAGRMSRNTPGRAREPYQPTPKPSPLVSVTASRQRRAWATRERRGSIKNCSR